MIRDFKGKSPRIGPNCQIAPNATVVGDVTLAEGVNVWYGAVLRGDTDKISIGAYTNIQDNAIAHCDPDIPLTVGQQVAVGHGAVLHSCTVEDHCVIGMGAVLMTGCRIGKNSIVAAGALVPGNMDVPPGSMVAGVPAKIKRATTPEEIASHSKSAQAYYMQALAHHFDTV